MFLLEAVLLGVGLPALVAAIALATLLALGRRIELPSGGRAAVALALGLGYLAGHAGVSLPSWPPVDVTDRIPFLVLAVVALGLLEASWPAPAWVGWENRILFSALTLGVIVGPAVGETWGTAATVKLAALGIGMVLVWANLEALAARVTGASIFLPLFVVAAGASVVSVLSGVMLAGRLGGVLSASLAVCALGSWWDPRLSLARGGVPITVVILASLVLVGHFYAEVPWPSVLLLALAPGAIWLVRIGPVRRLAPWMATILATAAVLVPVAAAVGFAVAAAVPSPEG